MVQSNQILQNLYRIIRILGKSGIGAVYEARHVKLNMICVVKELVPPDDPDHVELLAMQFECEGKTLASLVHTKIGPAPTPQTVPR